MSSDDDDKLSYKELEDHNGELTTMVQKWKREASTLLRENKKMSALIQSQQEEIAALQKAQSTTGALPHSRKRRKESTPPASQKGASSEEDEMELDLEAAVNEVEATQKALEDSPQSPQIAVKLRTYAAAAKAPAASTATARPPTVPPVTIKGTNGWTTVSKKLRSKGIQFDHAKVVGKNTKIFPKTSDDYRALTKTLEIEKTPYFTYMLPEEKKIHAVIRGLPVETTPKEICDELRLHYRDVEVTQMTNKRTHNPMPLFLVKTSDQGIWDIERMWKLDVKIEAKKKPFQQQQCYRCQQFGHTQSRCTFPETCVKCAQNHRSSACPLPAYSKETGRTATCVNCGEKGHPASYRGCPKSPKRTTTNSKRASNKATEGNLVKSIIEAMLPMVEKIINRKTTPRR